MPVTLPTPPELPRLWLARDYPNGALRTIVRAERLLRVGPGAYAQAPDGAVWDCEQQLALAAACAALERLGPGACLSHSSAALIHGFWLGPWDRLTHVTVAGHPKSQTTGLRRHVRRLPPEAITRVRGLRVTTAGQTAIDCACLLHPRWGLCVADSAMRSIIAPDRRDRATTNAHTERLRADLLGRLSAAGPTTGAPRARAVLNAADPYSESAGESQLRWLIVSHGLPTPTAQLPVETTRGTYFLDLGWTFRRTRPAPGEPPLLIIGEEYDGAEKYRPEPGVDPLAAVLAEKDREDALREAGAYLVRRRAPILQDPDRLVRLLRARWPIPLPRLRRVPGLYAP